MTPLYGFLQGDTIGLLVLADEGDTARDLAVRLISAAGVRVRAPERFRVVFAGKVVAPETTLAGAGITALDRFDVEEVRA